MDNFNNNQQQMGGQPVQPQMGQPMQPQMGQPMQPQMGQPMQPQMGQPMQPQMGQPMQPQMGQPMQQQMGQPMQQQMGQPMQPQMGGYQQQMGGYQQQMGGYQQQMGGYQQQMGGYQQMGQPMNYGKPAGSGIGVFFSSLTHDIYKLIGLIAAILIMVAPFFNWYSFRQKSDNYKTRGHWSAFRLANSDHLDSFGLGLLSFLIVLIGVCLILWDVADYVPALANIKYKLRSIPFEYILIGAALLFGLLIFFNGDLMDIISNHKEEIEDLKELDDSFKGHANHGLGPIILWIGIAARAVCAVLSSKK